VAVSARVLDGHRYYASGQGLWHGLAIIAIELVQSLQNIRQAVFLAFIYNVVSIAIATGIFSPDLQIVSQHYG